MMRVDFEPQTCRSCSPSIIRMPTPKRIRDSYKYIRELFTIRNERISQLITFYIQINYNTNNHMKTTPH